MPRPSEEFVNVTVPLKKNGATLLHLRGESREAKGGKRDNLGPYLAELLDDRDRAIYGGDSQGKWFASRMPLLQSIVKDAVKNALENLPTGTFQVSASRPLEISVEKMSEEASQAAASKLIAAFDDPDD